MRRLAALVVPGMMWLAAAAPSHAADVPLKPRPLSMVSPRAAVEIVGAISEERIARDLATLAGFGTRHTLSDTTSQTTGIGAARRWIRAQFEDAAKGSGGRMRDRKSVV